MLAVLVRLISPLALNVLTAVTATVTGITEREELFTMLPHLISSRTCQSWGEETSIFLTAECKDPQALVCPEEVNTTS